MTREQHLMVHLMEECAEVAQRCSKALRFGTEEVQPDPHDNPDGLTNSQRIVEELIDLDAVRSMVRLNAEHIPGYHFTRDETHERFMAKIAKVEKYLAYARERGTLEP